MKIAEDREVSLPATPVEDGDSAGTRTRVLRSLIEDGPATAAELADRLGLTAGGIRRHLDALAEQGSAAAAQQPPYGPRAARGRGRPARVYAVTQAGRATGSAADASLARDVLRHLRETFGDEGVRQFAEARVADQGKRFTQALADVPATERPRVLARMLTEEGFAASVDGISGSKIGVQICQHDCPVAHVASEFPELCDAESQMFSQVLGTHVQRLATLAHGDGVCTTHLPAAAQPTASARASLSSPATALTDRPARISDRSTT